MSDVIPEERHKSLYYIKKGNVFSIRFRQKKRKSFHQDVNCTAPNQIQQQYIQYIKQMKNTQHISVQYDINNSYKQILTNDNSIVRGNRCIQIKKFNMNNAWNSGLQPKYLGSVFQNKFLVESLQKDRHITQKNIQNKNKKLITNATLNHNSSPVNRKSQFYSTKKQNKFYKTTGDIGLFKGIIAHQCPIVSQNFSAQRKYGSFLR